MPKTHESIKCKEIEKECQETKTPKTGETKTTTCSEKQNKKENAGPQETLTRTRDVLSCRCLDRPTGFEVGVHV